MMKDEEIVDELCEALGGLDVTGVRSRDLLVEDRSVAKEVQDERRTEYRSELDDVEQTSNEGLDVAGVRSKALLMEDRSIAKEMQDERRAEYRSELDEVEQTSNESNAYSKESLACTSDNIEASDFQLRDSVDALKDMQSLVVKEIEALEEEHEGATIQKRPTIVVSSDEEDESNFLNKHFEDLSISPEEEKVSQPGSVINFIGIPTVSLYDTDLRPDSDEEVEVKKKKTKSKKVISDDEDGNDGDINTIEHDIPYTPVVSSTLSRSFGNNGSSEGPKETTVREENSYTTEFLNEELGKEIKEIESSQGPKERTGREPNSCTTEFPNEELEKVKSDNTDEICTIFESLELNSENLPKSSKSEKEQKIDDFKTFTASDVAEVTEECRPLRPYQRSIVKSVLSSLKGGNTPVLVYLPTGGGKTRIASELVTKFVNQKQRVLFVVNKDALVKQTYSAFTQMGLKEHIAFIKSNMSGKLAFLFSLVKQ
jgi:hypothetical protein